MNKPKSRSTLSLEAEIEALEAEAVEDKKPVEKQEEVVREPAPEKEKRKFERKKVEPEAEDEQDDGSEEEEELSKEEATFKQRHADLRRHSQKKERELKDQIDALSEKLQKAVDNPKVATSLTTEDEVAEWVEANPRAAALIQSLAVQSSKESVKGFESDLETMRADKLELAREKKLSKILKKHPDFEELQEDDTFLDWAEEIPQSMQVALFDSDDHEEVIKVLDFYKSYEKKLNETLDQKAASKVKSRSSTAKPETTPSVRFSMSQIEAMSLDEYEANQDAINEAHAKGLIADA